MEYLMSKKELGQVTTFEKLVAKRINIEEASNLLGLTERHVRRKLSAYEQKGAASLMHQGRGKPSNRKLKPELVERILALHDAEYYYMNIVQQTEYLFEKDTIKIDHETLRRLLIAHGRRINKKRTARREHVWREQKHHSGELIQLDGSIHKWFDDQYRTIMLCVDDATKEIYAEFADESTEGVMTFMANYFKMKGRPKAIYTDRGSVYKVNAEEKSAQKTQFGRALKELDIELVFAYSPQAKGRVERQFKALQDRFCSMLKYEKITTLPEAKECLKRFINQHNQKYAITPFSQESYFRPLTGYNLSTIMCLKAKRIIHNGRLVNFDGLRLVIDKHYQPHTVKIGDSVVIHKTFAGEITVLSKGKILKYHDTKRQKSANDEPDDAVYTGLRPWEVSLRNRTFLSSRKADISK